MRAFLSAVAAALLLAGCGEDSPAKVDPVEGKVAAPFAFDREGELAVSEGETVRQKER